jgi:hypothetical protein
MSLVVELKRRNIFRVAILYLISGWLFLQIVDLLLTAFGGGDWVYRFVFGMELICFPLVLIFSYLYEITPGGIRKEQNVTRELSITLRTGRRINRISRLVFLVALVLQVTTWLIR